jgi:hypothetical protein
MYFLVDFVFYLIGYAPGFPRRAQDASGRLKPAVRALLLALAGASAVYGVAIVRDAVRGYNSGALGTLLACGIGLLGGALLAGGVGCAVRALRNPPPPPLPDNVIPFPRAMIVRVEGAGPRPIERS